MDRVAPLHPVSPPAPTNITLDETPDPVLPRNLPEEPLITPVSTVQDTSPCSTTPDTLPSEQPLTPLLLEEPNPRTDDPLILDRVPPEAGLLVLSTNIRHFNQTIALHRGIVNSFTNAHPTTSAPLDAQQAEKENNHFLQIRMENFIDNCESKMLSEYIQDEVAALSFFAHLLVRDLVMLPDSIKLPLPPMITQRVENFSLPLTSEITTQREIFDAFDKDLQTRICKHFVETHLQYNASNNNTIEPIFDEDEEINQIAMRFYKQTQLLADRLMHRTPAFAACVRSVNQHNCDK